MFARFPLVLALAGAAALAALGCGSQHGEPCQIAGDCASGLTCCQIAINARGVCLAPGESCTSTGTDAGPRDAAVVDANTGVDAAATDAGADTGAADTGAADTGAADTGAADTGAADTGSTADTGVDTGV